MKKPREKSFDGKGSMIIDHVTWKNRTLHIDFHYAPPRSYNGSYTYYDVPEEVYLAFKQTDSKGQYFNSHIRNRYAHAH